MIKKFLIKSLFFGVVFFIFVLATYGMESINLLLFDQNSRALNLSAIDPFNHQFDAPLVKSKNSSDLSLPEHKRNESLALLRGFYQEGKNLSQFCDMNSTSDYASLWDENTVKRTILSNIQYHGMKISMAAIAAYSKKLGYSENNQMILKDNLIENYCSKNISFMGRKKLSKWFDSFFQNSDLTIPGASDDKQFVGLKTSENCKECLEWEMHYSVLLFRSFCSWGGRPSQLRLMTPIIKNPMIYAYFLREIFGEKLHFEKVNNVIYKTKTPPTQIVLCEDLLCRKVYMDEFDRKLPRSLGGIDVMDDFKRAYCSYFMLANLNLDNDDDIFRTWSRELKPEDHSFALSQLVSIIQGFPDIILRNLPLGSAEEMFYSGIDQNWQNWGNHLIQKTIKNLYYEEPLKLELVDRNFYFDVTSPEFKVYIDVNLGELDRTTQIIGKIPIAFSLKLPKNLLNWFRKKKLDFNPGKKQNYNLDTLLNRFQKYIVGQVKMAREQFQVPAWDSGLERLIAQELLEQVAKYEGNYFDDSSNQMVVIKVQLNYAPFALKYMRHKFLTTQKNNAIRSSQKNN